MRRAAVVATCIVAALGLLTVLWASSEGDQLLHQPSGVAGPSAADRTPSLTLESTTAVATKQVLWPPPTTAPPIDWLIIIVAFGVILLLLAVIRYVLSRLWAELEPPIQPDGYDELEELLKATGQGTRLLALSEGDPRNAVVASWVALEDAADHAGLMRDPAETSAEFTQRVLGRWEVDTATIRRLAGLYREARFSKHPISEGMRAEAVSAVQEIHDQLRRRAAAPPTPAADSSSRAP